VDEGRVMPLGNSWEALPGRALEVLAHACGARRTLGGRPGRAAEPPTVESVERLAAGVTTLAAALDRTASDRTAPTGPAPVITAPTGPAPVITAPTRTAPVITVPARVGTAPADASVELRRAVELLAELGEAARRVAATAGVVGQEPAAEVADSVMCVALTLRILAELVLRTVPPADAGGCPGR
jgi:hypothetical protein